MTRIGRPLAGTASDAAWLDGRCDAINERQCDPRGRWERWHPMRPASDWPAYLKSYVESYVIAAKQQRQHQQGVTP